MNNIKTKRPSKWLLCLAFSFAAVPLAADPTESDDNTMQPLQHTGAGASDIRSVDGTGLRVSPDMSTESVDGTGLHATNPTIESVDGTGLQVVQPSIDSVDGTGLDRSGQEGTESVDGTGLMMASPGESNADSGQPLIMADPLESDLAECAASNSGASAANCIPAPTDGD